MNKDHLLIDLSESECIDFGRVAFADQSHEQKVFSAIWALESQVNNGGFDQYFGSWDGETAEFAPFALRAIGANKCAAIVDKALRTVSSEPVPADAAKRCEILKSLSDVTRAKLNSLDAEFLRYPDNLSVLLFAFVESHPKTFGHIE